MKQANFGKVEFYRVTINTAISLIEERTGRKMHDIDCTIEGRVERAIEFANVKELKELHEALGEMYESSKRSYLTVQYH